MTKNERVEVVNKIIESIASTGRRFFYHDNRVSRMEVDARGRVWFVDSYSHRRVYTHSQFSQWRGFTNGGTLRDLVCHFRDFITKAKPVPAHCFGPWPEWLCHGDLWGYGDAMVVIRDRAKELELIN